MSQDNWHSDYLRGYSANPVGPLSLDSSMAHQQYLKDHGVVRNQVDFPKFDYGHSGALSTGSSSYSAYGGTGFNHSDNDLTLWQPLHTPAMILSIVGLFMIVLGLEVGSLGFYLAVGAVALCWTSFLMLVFRGNRPHDLS